LSKANNDTLRFVLQVPTAGTYHLSFRYANGKGPGNSDNKCGVRTLWVNGKQAATYVFPQRGTNEWSNWGISNVEAITLKAGENELKLQFDPWNENMNGTVNDFILDQILLDSVE
jgi:hypothetical protein